MNNKKQLIGIFIVIVVAFAAIWYALTSYKNIQRENHANEVLYGEPTNTDTPKEEELPWDSSRILVVYFSRNGENYNVGDVKVGNTAMVASYIKEYLDIDSFEIETVKAYPEDYEETVEVVTKEQKNNERPELKKSIETLDNYDTIFLGYPIWNGDLPPAVYTFLETHNFDGKTIIPFNTHEGSNDAGTYKKLKELLPNSNVVLNGLYITGSVARSARGKNITINYLKELGYLRLEDIKNMKLDFEILKDVSEFENSNITSKGNELIEKEGFYYLVIRYGEVSTYYSSLAVDNVSVKGNEITVSVSLPKDGGQGDAFSYPIAVIKLNKEPDSIKVIYK